MALANGIYQIHCLTFKFRRYRRRSFAGTPVKYERDIQYMRSGDQLIINNKKNNEIGYVTATPAPSIYQWTMVYIVPKYCMCNGNMELILSQTSLPFWHLL